MKYWKPKFGEGVEIVVLPANTPGYHNPFFSLSSNLAKNYYECQGWNCPICKILRSEWTKYFQMALQRGGI